LTGLTLIWQINRPTDNPHVDIPAKAGIQQLQVHVWIPALRCAAAGMTNLLAGLLEKVEEPIMLQENLMPGITLERTHRHIHVQFDSPSWVISSAVLNGGLIQADHILNLNIRDHIKDGCKKHKPPEITLAKYCADCGWSGKTVGMMTAASMDSFRMARVTEQKVDIIVLVTAGLSNVRRAGDYAEHREIGASASATGTINIICLTSACLTQAAMIEAIITATEAKTAALQNLGIKSPVSDAPATGTGTDAIAIATGQGPLKIKYCGKHVIFGEILANLTIKALTSSIT